MSFYEGLHSELTKDKRRRPLLWRLFLSMLALVDQLGRRLRKRRA